jgi:hypothetical protein
MGQHAEKLLEVWNEQWLCANKFHAHRTCFGPNSIDKQAHLKKIKICHIWNIINTINFFKPVTWLFFKSWHHSEP